MKVIRTKWGTETGWSMRPRALYAYLDNGLRIPIAAVYDTPREWTGHDQKTHKDVEILVRDCADENSYHWVAIDPLVGAVILAHPERKRAQMILRIVKEMSDGRIE